MSCGHLLSLVIVFEQHALVSHMLIHLLGLVSQRVVLSIHRRGVVLFMNLTSTLLQLKTKGKSLSGLVKVVSV